MICTSLSAPFIATPLFCTHAMPSPAIDAIAAPDRRLHPLSWLFVLVQQLKQFLLPLLILLLFGRGDRNELWGLVAVCVLALVSIWQYYTYRYRIEADSLVVRSGLLERSLRQIPFARIHNVALHQTLLHRLFGVAEVRLESAGGRRPEAEMRVLRLDQAHALEALVRRHAQTTATAMVEGTEGDAASQAIDQPRELLRLPVGEVIRLGMISNRGMLVVGAAFATLSQINPDLLHAPVERFARMLVLWLDLHRFGFTQYLFAAVGLTLAVVLLLQLLSVALALLQYAGFRLTETGPRLTIERGLLTRIRTSASRRRIQAWTLKEGLLHRAFGRRALLVDTAAAQHQSEQRAFRELAPVAPPERADALVRHVLDGARWPPQRWLPLHPRAWWRLVLPGLIFGGGLALLLCWHFGAWGLFGLLWWPWAVLAARRNAQRAGYALEDELIAVREGWWSRHWRFAELDKLQVLRLRRGPLDRRLGMATLWLDTAGAGAFAPPLRIRFLPLDAAQALHARLAAEIARRPLRW
jgi:putative membrane protein